MRFIRYKQTEWLIPWKFRRKKELHLFIVDIPYCLYWSVVPSRSALNEVLRRGHAGGGMGEGRIWDGFEVDEVEYNEVLLHWKTTDIRKILGVGRNRLTDMSFIYDDEIMKIPDHLDYLKKSREKYESHFWGTPRP
jgi:hypothetical protein